MENGNVRMFATLKRLNWKSNIRINKAENCRILSHIPSLKFHSQEYLSRSDWETFDWIRNPFDAKLTADSLPPRGIIFIDVSSQKVATWILDSVSNILFQQDLPGLTAASGGSNQPTFQRPPSFPSSEFLYQNPDDENAVITRSYSIWRRKSFRTHGVLFMWMRVC